MPLRLLNQVIAVPSWFHSGAQPPYPLRVRSITSPLPSAFTMPTWSVHWPGCRNCTTNHLLSGLHWYHWSPSA